MSLYSIIKAYPNDNVRGHANMKTRKTDEEMLEPSIKYLKYLLQVRFIKNLQAMLNSEEKINEAVIGRKSIKIKSTGKAVSLSELDKAGFFDADGKIVKRESEYRVDIDRVGIFEKIGIKVAELTPRNQILFDAVIWDAAAMAIFQEGRRMQLLGEENLSMQAQIYNKDTGVQSTFYHSVLQSLKINVEDLSVDPRGFEINDKLKEKLKQAVYIHDTKRHIEEMEPQKFGTIISYLDETGQRIEKKVPAHMAQIHKACVSAISEKDYGTGCKNLYKILQKAVKPHSGVSVLFKGKRNPATQAFYEINLKENPVAQREQKQWAEFTKSFPSIKSSLGLKTDKDHSKIMTEKPSKGRKP